MEKEDKTLTIKENNGNDSIIIDILPDDPLKDIQTQLDENAVEIRNQDEKIDRLTNKADSLDYSIAIASGIISGLIDAFFVGEFSLANARNWGCKNIDDKIMKNSNAQNIVNAIKGDEKKYKSVGDQVASEFGYSDHHFNDFTHHKSPLGLITSIISQFTGDVYGINPVTKTLKKQHIPDFQSTLTGNNFFEKIINAIRNWNGHLLSDMAGSSLARAKGNYGSGIPGPIMSSLSEFSTLPIFKDKNGQNKFYDSLFDLFKNKQLDYRMEKGLIHESSKQFLPVTVNELLVRFYYAIRKLTEIIKEKGIEKVSDINLDTIKDVIFPNNRTISRMLTISTGVMSAIDISDALLRSNGTLTGFSLRVNYVGLARFSIALGQDCIQGIKKNISLKERMELINERNILLNKKTFILNKGNFIQLDNNEKDIKEIENLINEISSNISNIHDENVTNLNSISSSIDKIREDEKDMLNEMKDVLDW